MGGALLPNVRGGVGGTVGNPAALPAEGGGGGAEEAGVAERLLGGGCGRGHADVAVLLKAFTAQSTSTMMWIHTHM